jgi:hypothetical protein
LRPVDGTYFKILQRNVLVDEVFPKYFSQMKKFASFQRQLNYFGRSGGGGERKERTGEEGRGPKEGRKEGMKIIGAEREKLKTFDPNLTFSLLSGFKRHPKEQSSYYHSHFQRDRKDLLKFVKRKMERTDRGVDTHQPTRKEWTHTNPQEIRAMPPSDISLVGSVITPCVIPDNKAKCPHPTSRASERPWMPPPTKCINMEPRTLGDTSTHAPFQQIKIAPKNFVPSSQVARAQSAARGRVGRQRERERESEEGEKSKSQFVTGFIVDPSSYLMLHGTHPALFMFSRIQQNEGGAKIANTMSPTTPQSVSQMMHSLGAPQPSSLGSINQEDPLSPVDAMSILAEVASKETEEEVREVCSRQIFSCVVPWSLHLACVFLSPSFTRNRT